MSYWCDDRALYREQRRLDALQARAAKAIEARRAATGNTDAVEDESAVAASDLPNTPGEAQ